MFSFMRLDREEDSRFLASFYLCGVSLDLNNNGSSDLACSSVGGKLASHAQGPEFAPHHWTNQLWWFTYIISALGKEKRQDQKFMSILTKFMSSVGSMKPSH